MCDEKIIIHFRALTELYIVEMSSIYNIVFLQ